MKIYKINQGSKYHNKLFESTVKASSEIIYKINDIFQNEEKYYFELIGIEYDVITKQTLYTLISIGYYKKISNRNTNLTNFKTDLSLITNNELINKIRQESEFL